MEEAQPLHTPQNLLKPAPGCVNPAIDVPGDLGEVEVLPAPSGLEEWVAWSSHKQWKTALLPRALQEGGFDVAGRRGATWIKRLWSCWRRLGWRRRPRPSLASVYCAAGTRGPARRIQQVPCGTWQRVLQCRSSCPVWIASDALSLCSSHGSNRCVLLPLRTLLVYGVIVLVCDMISRYGISQSRAFCSARDPRSGGGRSLCSSSSSASVGGNHAVAGGARGVTLRHVELVREAGRVVEVVGWRWAAVEPLAHVRRSTEHGLVAPPGPLECA